MRALVLLALVVLVAVNPAAGAPPHVAPVPPVCADDAAPGSGRAVVVYAYPADRASRHAPIAPLLAQLVEQVNGALDVEAGPFPASYVVECGADGRVLVHEEQVTTPRDATTFQTLKRDLAARGYASPDAKYWVWFDGPSQSLGELGVSDPVFDDRLSPDNEANSGPHYVVLWGATPYSLDWRVLMHESAHTMGAVLPGAHEGTGDGHTNAPRDVLIPVLENPSVNPAQCWSPWRCRVNVACEDRWHFDCGHDTYFNADPDQRVIPHWQIGSRLNRFLDFRNQAPYDPAIACPPQAQAGETVECLFFAFDREGSVRFTVDWGDGAVESSGLVPAGQGAEMSHAWSVVGDATVRVTAQDEQGLTSEPATHVVRVLDCAVDREGLLRLGLPLVAVEGLTATPWTFMSSACWGKGYALSPENVEVEWRDADGAPVAPCGRTVPAGAGEWRVVAQSGTNVVWSFEAPAAAPACP